MIWVSSRLCDTVIVMYAGQIVEKAPVDELFADPKHPYSEGLLHAIPRITKERKPLLTIEGAVPNRRRESKDVRSGLDVLTRRRSAKERKRLKSS